MWYLTMQIYAVPFPENLFVAIVLPLNCCVKHLSVLKFVPVWYLHGIPNVEFYRNLHLF